MRIKIYIFTLLALTGLLSAQKLPDGKRHFSRERSIDIMHMKLDLVLDMQNQKIEGTACLTLKPLHRISDFELDAIKLQIDRIRHQSGTESVDLAYRTNQSKLHIFLEKEYAPDDSMHICISYKATPRDGMYFSTNPKDPGQKYCYTYGEGGLHANWMPVYAENDDKFTSEMIVGVDPPNMVISNGRLISTSPEGKYHWRQEKPHANYLVVIYAGIFETGSLKTAGENVPMAYWVPSDNRERAEFTFRNTPDMIRLFSHFTDTAYPWEKYDQVVIPGYAIGGMEHTSATGLYYAVLRDSLAPASSSPDFDTYHQVWTSESLVSHELAHMWFGDLVTCKDLRYIWLNESFATYMQFIWDRQYFGEMTFDFDRLSALDQYLNYARDTHVIRPLQYDRFDTPDEIYNEQHTYLKGALILHMLNKFLGEADFQSVLRTYFDRYAYQNVVSQDLKTVIEMETGKVMDWFFDDWIYGAGHPVLEVSYEYLADINQILLKIAQVQPLVEGQGLFRLPVTITIETGIHRFEQQINISEADEEILIPCPDYPLMVSFDGAGDLVAEIREEKSFQDWIYQGNHDSGAGRVRALRHLVAYYPNDDQTYDLLYNIIKSDSIWYLRAEAALLSGILDFPQKNEIVEIAEKDKDYRVRKALAIGLREGPSDIASERLQQFLSNEDHLDVQATILVSLSLIDPETCKKLIPEYIEKDSWYDELKLAAAEAMQNIADKELLDQARLLTSDRNNYQVRRSAFRAWIATSPEDADLERQLMHQVQYGSVNMRNFSIDALGEIRSQAALESLRKLAETSGDPNIRISAGDAVKRIMQGQITENEKK